MQAVTFDQVIITQLFIKNLLILLA